MPIRFFCAKCKFRLRTPDESSGMRIICSRCGHSQTVPANTDPVAEKTSVNRRAFLAAESARLQEQSSLEASGIAYYGNADNQPIQMIVDDEEDVFMAEIAEDENIDAEVDDADQHEHIDPDSPLGALGQALAQGPQVPMPDLTTPAPKPAPLDGAQALAGLAEQVISAPAPSSKSSTFKPAGKPAAKPAPKPPAKKPVKKPTTYLRPVQARPPGNAPTRHSGRVTKLVVWTCRIAAVAGIPAAVKLGLVAKDISSDSLVGLATAVTIGMLAMICLTIGEIADAT